MKKLIFLFLSVLTVGSLFQSCSNSKTYADMLDDEKDAVNDFIKEKDIRIISLTEFERDTITTSKDNGDAYDEYVAFSNGVYMQIVSRQGEGVDREDKFGNNNSINARYVEENLKSRDTICFNVALEKYMDIERYYRDPLTFRYVKDGSSLYGVVLSDNMSYDYLWTSNSYGTAIPSGWLVALPYLRNYAHVRLIVPSKMGHQTAQQYVTPYFYDIRAFSKTRS